MSDNKLRKLPFILGVFLLCIAVVYSACSRPSSSLNADLNPVEYNPRTVLDEIQSYGLSSVGVPLVQEITLPDEFTGPNWGIKADACEAGGYNLNPHAGQTAFLTEYNLTVTYRKEPLNVYILTQGSRVICAYIAVQNSSSIAPGVFAIDLPLTE
jgi:hypothetical protein